MKKIYTLLLSASFFTFNSNAQTSDLINYLPEKASLVIDIDCGSMSQKLSSKDLMEIKFFDSLFKKLKAESKQQFIDPSGSGLNNLDHFFVVMDMKKDMENGNVTFFAKVADESKLSRMLQKLEDKKATMKTVGQNKLMVAENFVVGWNKSVFVVHSQMPFKKWSQTGTNRIPDEKKKPVVSLEKQCIALLSPKQTGPANRDLETFAQSKGDFKMWIDGKSFMSELNTKGPLSPFKMSSFMQPDHQGVVVNFEKGKVVTKSYAYYDESALPAVQNIYGERLNSELFKKIPAGDLFGLYAATFKPGGIKDFFEKSGLLAELKKEGKAPPVDAMAVLDNLKGDILVAVTMLEKVNDEKPAPKTPFSNLNIFFAATVKDEIKVKRLIDSIKQLIDEKKKQKQPDAPENDEMTKRPDFTNDLKISTRVENGMFLLTINGAGEADLVSTTKYDTYMNEYGQRPTLMILDMKTLVSLVMKTFVEKPGSNEQSEFLSMFETFDKMIVSGGNFEKNALVTTQEFRFTDANENSLKQLLKVFDIVFSAISKSKQKGKDIEMKEN